MFKLSVALVIGSLMAISAESLRINAPNHDLSTATLSDLLPAFDRTSNLDGGASTTYPRLEILLPRDLTGLLGPTRLFPPH